MVAAGVGFVLLFGPPFLSLLNGWWSDPEAAHGLLLGPLAVWFAWRRGLIDESEAVPRPVLGLIILMGAVALRYASGLAAELFTMRVSMLVALVAIVVAARGLRQLRAWWLPAALLVFSVPLPAVVTGTIALPLQLEASRMGAALLEWRQVPVLLSGNVIHIPGRTLFVTEACSGLRSLSSLLALGVLQGGLWLRIPAVRVLLLVVTLPVAMAVNGVRVFLTGFLVFFVAPEFGEGFMHYTEGWLLFLFSFGILGAVTWALVWAESRFGSPFLRPPRRHGT
ncbi:MAG TPA: exosortase/archaeosortase family protein [Longimicrobiales bacterium]|nr:exosortase/archaeosortase family protein [Longimicrobiales bacterium]